MANQRIKQLPEIITLKDTMIVPIYDYETDTTYFTKLKNIAPNTGNVTSNRWNISTNYPINFVAEYNGELYRSTIDNNLGNIPGAGAEWSQVTVGYNPSTNQIAFVGKDTILNLGTLATDTVLTFVNEQGGRFILVFTVATALKLTLPDNTTSKVGEWEQNDPFTFTIIDPGDYAIYGVWNGSKWILSLN